MNENKLLFSERTFYGNFLDLQTRWSNKTNPWSVTSCWFIEHGVLWIELSCTPDSLGPVSERKESFLLWDDEHWEWVGDEICDPTYERVGFMKINWDKPVLGKLHVRDTSALKNMVKAVVEPRELRLTVTIPEVKSKAARGKLMGQ